MSSCSTKKDILYIQDLSSKKNIEVNYVDYLLKPDDILKIDINSENQESLLAFNSIPTTAEMNVSKTALLYNGYIINNDGNIFFPSIGKLYVAGKTIDEVRVEIYDFLTKGGFLTNPTIDIKLINAFFTILGEVNSPGKYDFNQNNLNIFEAIGMAGDLTINGRRDNVKLIREIGDKRNVFSYDLTSSNILESENFQIFSGDLIIVSPNSSRIKNAGIIGNSGTLISLLSFILSSIIIISNSNWNGK